VKPNVRNSFKAKHLAAHPYVSLSYWDQSHQLAYAECDAKWVDDPAEKARLEQQGDVDLSTMMQDGDATQAPTEDSAADMLKNLQGENK